MVTKTRRKHSAVKRVKTAKRRKNNTRSKRGRGGRGGRSAKRGGMPLTAAARVAARSAAAAAKHAQRIHTLGPLYGVVPKTISEQFIDKEKETTSNPVEMAITGKGVGDNMEKSAYNEHRRELFANQTPARPHNPAYFSTPKRDSTLHDIHNYTPFRQPIDSTPPVLRLTCQVRHHRIYLLQENRCLFPKVHHSSEGLRQQSQIRIRMVRLRIWTLKMLAND